MYNVTKFYKTYIENFVNIFPNIILNKVNFENTHIPNYYGFSKNHANKLKNYMQTQTHHKTSKKTLFLTNEEMKHLINFCTSIEDNITRKTLLKMLKDFSNKNNLNLY